MAAAKKTDPRHDALDAKHMQRCLELAASYRGLTSPNPIVGCVILDAAGKKIAEGVHRGPGTPHAEADALAKLEGGKLASARRGTLYCNLEPCTHQGRTPPCVPPIKAAGLARVVVGTEDPIPGHGGGIEALRRGKIVVDRALVAECDRANRPFLTWSAYGRPALTLKAGITLDGKIATWAGNSKWITDERSRADAHLLRAQHDAVLVGIETVLKDDPWLKVDYWRGARDPVRIVLDTRLRIPLDARMLPGTSDAERAKKTRVIIATSAKAPPKKIAALEARGCEVWKLPTHANGRLQLYELLRRLAKSDVLSVLVEGGGEVHHTCLKERLADEIVLYLAPRAFGNRKAPSWVGGQGVKVLQAAYEFEFETVERLDRDLKITCRRRPERERPVTDDDDELFEPFEDR